MTNKTTFGENRSSKLHRIGRLATGLSAVAVAGSMALAAAPAGAALGTVTTTPQVPAGAYGSNNLLIGTGSSTTYQMMTQLDALYNQSPGCTTTVDFPNATAQQPLDFSCLTPTQDANGKVLAPVNPSVATTTNPFNDVAVDETPIGSSNGILMLETGGGSQTALNAKYGSLGGNYNVFSGASYARSSRASSSSDDKGLNFVAYARDGVSWAHFSQTSLTTNTASVVPGNILSTAELTDIWKGKISKWSQVGGGNNPIIVFSAQEGSGTQATWKGTLGTDPSAGESTSFYANCFNRAGLTLLSATGPSSSQCAGPINIFENETQQMVLGSLPDSMKNPNATSPGLNAGASVSGGVYSESLTATGATAPAVITPSGSDPCTNWYLGCTAGPVVTTSVGHYSQKYTFNLLTEPTLLGKAIFFYSSGAYNHQCPAAGGVNTPTTCATNNFFDYALDPTGKADFKQGQIGGTGDSLAIGSTTVLAPQTCGAAPNFPQGDPKPCFPSQVSVLTGDFPSTRYVYNVYSNGFEASNGLPEATTAAMTYVSETGFICSERTKAIIDPTTGISYRTEIDNVMLNSGFYPLSAGASTGVINTTAFDGGSLGTYGSATLGTAANDRYTPFLQPVNTAGNGNPMGFCVASNTQGANGGATGAVPALPAP